MRPEAAQIPTPSPLDDFGAPARAWFEAAFERPTPVQEQGWRSVAAGNHTLMCAPTGSGKTLAAFFWCIDQLAREPLPVDAERCRVLYVSPLKALTVDVERNLRSPLTGISLEARRAGVEVPGLTVAVRTGDTPANERRQIERHPPDILITTPESLFLMLTSAVRQVLASVRWVIVDEIHSMAGTKRGAHLALSLERLSSLAVAEPQRIGLSATQRPLEEVGRFLGGAGRDVALVDTGERKPLELTVEVPVEDMANLERGTEGYSGPAAALGGEASLPRRSIWPAIHPRLLELIRAHRSTIVFVNSRRLAERLAARLNELWAEQAEAEGLIQLRPDGRPPELVRAHHGSIAREQRAEIEDALKSGRLPALVATSSLELGIDMGAVDLVIQVESPPSVSAGLQRIGRAGHHVGEPSKGVIFPKHRGDLLEAAAVVEGMLQGRIETTRVPRNPLDVLAQQVVAMCALDQWQVEDMLALVRRAYPYSDLGERAFTAVLDMLAGRYPSDDFAELRPRIVWDRVAGTLRGRAGAQRLAVVSGGTIPDRGLFAVNLFEGAGDTRPTETGFAAAGIAAPPGGRRPGRRIGELDEEMVYEMRPGQTFILGASSWKVVEITHSEVLVVPAPGEPGTIAFWHGDALGRPVELGREIGRLTREVRALPREEAMVRLRDASRLDGAAVRNLLGFLDEQAAATGAVPDDHTIVVERFRDQLGDWRMCVLTPFGARVHAPWALAVAAQVQERTGNEVQAIHTDDGFAIRLGEADEPPPLADLFLDPEDVRSAVTAQLQGSALFASRFRENAARSLLLPRRRPDQRTPLWQQRQRSHDLLQVASRHPDFPVILETYRECLSDVFDLDALAELMSAVRQRTVRVVEVETERASPFASSLMFDYIAQYMYEGDSPIGERRAQALTLDRELLAELLGDEELRELIDPAAIASLELELQGLLPERWPRDVDEAADLLFRLGDLSLEEAAARGVGTDWLEVLVREQRALRTRLAGEDRWISVEDAARYRDGLGIALPPGLPVDLLAGAVQLSQEAALELLLTRYARTHVPFTAAEVAHRYRLDPALVESALRRVVVAGKLLSGAFSPSGPDREYCHADVLAALRRRSLAALRKEIEPVAVDAVVRFLPAWHGVQSMSRGHDRLAEVVRQLQGAAIPASVLERDVLATRVFGYTPALIDHLMSTGDVVWTGRGSLSRGDGRVALYLRADAAQLIAAPGEPPAGDLHRSIVEHLRDRGASFFADLLGRSGGGETEVVLDALWDLVWSGHVTNDTLLPLRSRVGFGPGRGRRPSSRRPLMRLTPPGAEGRWSLVADLTSPAITVTERLHAIAGTLLQRYGVLTREAALAEGVPGGFAALYPVLRAMEEAGRIRRGYFVEGLGGSQFALPGAVDRLRAARQEEQPPVTLAATDPANPFGVTVPWPATAAGRAARQAGALVVITAGRLRLYLERGGHSLLTFDEAAREDLAALAAVAPRLGRLEVRTVDGDPVAGSRLEPLMRDVGFGISPRGLVIWPERGSSASA
ncbi:MAG: ATP-dependent helicase Lhr and Lhr-like helicase [Chloroflexota bacterium]|jgi:ATP-dependent Lhr-like helicase|nr:ATP-dependent helicase Lhr and Lhr-like helicase [Chloroflexota bacterium]